MYANKLVTTRHAIENKIHSRSQVVEPGASNNPPDPRRVSSACVVFLFFSFNTSTAHNLACGIDHFHRAAKKNPAMQMGLLQKACHPVKERNYRAIPGYKPSEWTMRLTNKKATQQRYKEQKFAQDHHFKEGLGLNFCNIRHSGQHMYNATVLMQARLSQAHGYSFWPTSEHGFTWIYISNLQPEPLADWLLVKHFQPAFTW
eukprot:1150582-Pelagomonas_calceolata.AAC.2